MRICLEPGERLFVTMDDAEDDDDGVVVEYDFQDSGKLQVSANYPDDKKRDGVIYSATIDDGDDEEKEDKEKDQVVKTISCSSCGNDFNLTKGEVDFMQGIFGEKYHEPLRCKKCRMLRMRRCRTPKDSNK
jgi:predicted RNA-binding Zn-ribbon protein involved in translation (DUF1610 family)